MAEPVNLITQADRDGLDLFTVAGHPYFGAKLDTYALVSFLPGQAERIAAMVTVTNLPSRPAPVLARTIIYRSTDDTPAAEALACWAGEIVPAVRDAIAFPAGQPLG